jgi:hypothetical protein
MEEKETYTIEEKETYDNLIWVDDAYCRGKRDHLL